MPRKPDTRTWTPEQVATQERVLEDRVSEAANELERARTRRRAAVAKLRKFRKAKITKAHQIVPAAAR